METLQSFISFMLAFIGAGFCLWHAVGLAIRLTEFYKSAMDRYVQLDSDIKLLQLQQKRSEEQEGFLWDRIIKLEQKCETHITSS